MISPPELKYSILTKHLTCLAALQKQLSLSEPAFPHQQVEARTPTIQTTIHFNSASPYCVPPQARQLRLKNWKGRSWTPEVAETQDVYSDCHPGSGITDTTISHTL